MENTPSPQLTVVIIRHGEKPAVGGNLTPQGLTRSLQLPYTLQQKFGIPDFIYVPTLLMDTETLHARMFQTATPTAIQFNLAINTRFDEKDATGLASHVREKTGTVLIVWEHRAIKDILEAFGVTNAPTWPDDDFDSIWVIIVNQHNQPVLLIDRQHLSLP